MQLNPARIQRLATEPLDPAPELAPEQAAAIVRLLVAAPARRPRRPALVGS
jgi:hypothetical protein